jgi:hypothetical protein
MAETNLDTLPEAETSFLKGLMEGTDQIDPAMGFGQGGGMEAATPTITLPAIEPGVRDDGIGLPPSAGSLVKSWVQDQIVLAASKLNIDQSDPKMFDLIGQIENAVWQAALGGKLGDGTPSSETAGAIADMVDQLVASNQLAPAKNIRTVATVRPVAAVPKISPIESRRRLREDALEPTEEVAIDEPIEPMDRINSDQAAALNDYAAILAAEGTKDWKASLQSAWRTGTYEGEIDDNLICALEQIKCVVGGETKKLKTEKVELSIEPESGPTSDLWLIPEGRPRPDGSKLIVSQLLQIIDSLPFTSDTLETTSPRLSPKAQQWIKQARQFVGEAGRPISRPSAKPAATKWGRSFDQLLGG